VCGFGCIEPRFLYLRTTALVGDDGSASRPRSFELGEIAYGAFRIGGSLVWMLWGSENVLPYQDTNSDPSIVQPVASRPMLQKSNSIIPQVLLSYVARKYHV
jgi:hypothetical protein